MNQKKRIGIVLLAVVIAIINRNVQVKCECETNIAESKIEHLQPYESPRYPQTIVHDIVMEFLQSEQGNRNKKVLVLGYDGFREAALQNVFGMQQSAVKQLAQQGGIYQSYAGANGKQETSTAPGWYSILHGDWAYKDGIIDNSGSKPANRTTFLQESANLGYRSIFLASWPTHFEVTYREDFLFRNENMEFEQTDDDEETVARLQGVLSDTSPNARDVIFATLEYTDHAGHQFGYGNESDEYVAAAKEVDQKAYQLLQIIQQRITYPQEEWLIILTTDHGGIGSGHGGTHLEESNTWFVMNREMMKE